MDRARARVLALGVPVMVRDATHAEALGPALASALLLVASPRHPGHVHFVGDSEAVTSLLN